MASWRGVGLEISDVSGRPRGLALIVDVDIYFIEPVIRAVYLVARHQGEGVNSGVSRGFGIAFFVCPFPAGHEPLDDINEEQGSGRDEEYGPVSKP